MKRCLLALLLTLACSSAGVKATLPSGWTAGDAKLSYDRLPVLSGMPQDVPRHYYLSPGGMVVEVFAVDRVLSDKRKSRWGLIHNDMEEAYAAQLKDRQTHVLGEEQEEWSSRTADGTTVELAKVRILPGLLAGKDVVWVTGVGKKGDELLLINGGCMATDWDRGQVESLVQGLSW